MNLKRDSAESCSIVPELVYLQLIQHVFEQW
jgi:hypothetical protein